MKEHRLRLDNDRWLNWYEVGQGKPLVLLHGWSMSAAVFSEFAGLLDEEFRIFIPDLPGHGQSSPAQESDLEGLAKDLKIWMDITLQEPFAIAGWSLGGMLGIHVAERYHLALEKLVLISTTPRFTLCEDWAFGLPVGQVNALSRNLRQRFESTLAEFFKLTFAGETLSPDRLREIRNFAVYQGTLPDREVAHALLKQLAVQDQREALAKISQPTLVLHGELDKISPVEAGQQLSEMLPNGHFVRLPGVGHAPFLSQPLEIAKRVRKFC